MKNREIILVRGTEIEYNDEYKLLIDTVGQWDKVSDEELNILQAIKWKYGFFIIERNAPIKMYGKKEELRTVQDYLKLYYEEQKKREEADKKRAAISEEKKLERKRKQLARLKQELGDESD
jgi:hypothetical protein